MEYAVVVAFAFIILLYFTLRKKQKAHDNPADQTVVDYDQLHDICRLEDGGQYVVITYRQSGNEHQDRRLYDSIESAITAGATTMIRSQIPYVLIRHNDAKHFEFGRPFHDARGRQEGKKVGWIEIVRVEV